MLFLGEGFIPSPTPSHGLDLGGYSSVKSWILTQNRHLESIDFHWFRMRHPSKMEILEFSQGGGTEIVMSLKTAFSHEASSKNCIRKHAFFRFFICFELLKLELSPTRELDLSCFQNCIGRYFWVTKIFEIAVLPWCQLCFEDVHALTTKNHFFWKCSKTIVFPMFFVLFCPPGTVPGHPWITPWSSMLPIWLQAVLGSLPVPSNRSKIDWKTKKNLLSCNKKQRFRMRCPQKTAVANLHCFVGLFLSKYWK